MGDSYRDMSAAFTSADSVTEEKKGSAPAVMFTLDFNTEKLYYSQLHQRLIPLKQVSSEEQKLSFTAKEMKEKLEELICFNTSDLDPSEKHTVEEYRLALIKTVHNHLHGYEEPGFTPPPVKMTRQERLMQWMEKLQLPKWAAFLLLLAIVLAPIVATGLLYTNVILVKAVTFIPFVIPSAVLTGVGLITVGLSLIGTIWFFAPNKIMEWVGITFSAKNDSLFEVYQQQLALTQEINDKLLRPNDLSSKEYSALALIAAQLNNHIAVLQQNNPPPKKNLIQKIVHAVTVGGAVIQALGASIYFAGFIVGLCIGSTLPMLSLILSMPLVIAAVAAVPFLIASAMIYHSRDNNLFNISSKEDKQHDALTEKLDHFSKVEFQQLSFERRVLEKEKRNQRKKGESKNTLERNEIAHKQKIESRLKKHRELFNPTKQTIESGLTEHTIFSSLWSKLNKVPTESKRYRDLPEIDIDDVTANLTAKAKVNLKTSG